MKPIFKIDINYQPDYKIWKSVWKEYEITDYLHEYHLGIDGFSA